MSLEVDKLNFFSLFCQFNISWRSKLRSLIFTKSHQYTPKRFLDLRAPQNLRFFRDISSFGFLSRISPFFGGQEKLSNLPLFWKLSGVSWCWNESTCFFHVGFGETSATKKTWLVCFGKLEVVRDFWKLKRLSFTPEVYFNFFAGPNLLGSDPLKRRAPSSFRLREWPGIFFITSIGW